jgi:serine/threonine-protein kinase HipA
LEEAFRRVCFNILAVNQDDHVKNLAFLMDDTGRWSLAPAYDLTYARGAGFTRRHQMSLAGKRDGFTPGDLLAAGERFGLRDGGRAILACIGEVLSKWPKWARESGVPAQDAREIHSALRLDLVPRDLGRIHSSRGRRQT